MNINIRGNLYDLSRAKVMGILNVTPDSFYDGGVHSKSNEIENHVNKMINDGMDILDIGGYSSRPGAKIITENEEMSRVLPIVKHLKKVFPDLIISIDTFRSTVANASLAEGADIINDISSGTLDNKMMNVISEYNCPYILMHMQGRPHNMQNDPNYNDVTLEIIQYLAQKVKIAHDNNIVDLIVDPGFGFGKTKDHNFKILNNLEKFKILELPVLAGFSRKSMIYETLKSSSENALNGTSSLNTIALMKGVKILRVHDIKEIFEALKIQEALNSI